METTIKQNEELSKPFEEGDIVISYSDNIVLVTRIDSRIEFTGRFIAGPNEKFHEQFEESSYWVIDSFKKFEGQIILENDKE